MFGNSLLPLSSGGRLLLGGAVCATVVLNSSMPTPYSQILSWRVVWFVWNLRLTRKEVPFYLDVSKHGLLSFNNNEIKRNLFYLEQEVPHKTNNAPTRFDFACVAQTT